MRFRLPAVHIPLSTSIMVAALVLLSASIPFVISTPAGASINVDGDFSLGEWIPPLELRASNTTAPWGPDNDLRNLYVSWDADNLYVGVEGFSSENNVFFIYVDSSARTAGAEQNDFYPGFHTQSEGWDPDFVYAVCEMENGIGADVRRILPNGSTETVSGTQHASRWGYHNANGIGGWEISIPWSAVGTAAHGWIKVGAGLGWATDKYDTTAPIGGASKDELGRDLDNDRWSLDNPVQLVYDEDGDGVPDDIRAALDSVAVRFEFHAPGAATVNLAGDFNGWCDPSGVYINTAIDPMSDPNGDGIWTIDRALPWGYTEYKFVQDGHIWYSDPRNPDVNRNDNWNSILVVSDPLVYYLSPLEGSVVSLSRPPISASIATSASSTLDLGRLKIYVDDVLAASGPSFYDPTTRAVSYAPLDSLAEGTHEVKISVCNTQGYCSVDSSRFDVDLDFVPPVITHAPIGNQPANQPVLASASITDDEGIASARLLYREQNNAQTHTTAFLEGLDNVWYAEIPASFILEGRVIQYAIEAADRVNTTRVPSSGWYSFHVLVDDTAPVITEAFVSPPTISPNGDGADDVARISFRLSETMNVSVEIRTAADVLVRQLLSAAPRGSGYQKVLWDGRNAGGAVVPNGDYRYEIRGTDLAGHESGLVTGPITVTASAPAGALNLVILFHANQTLNYQGNTADDVCFNGLLAVLRRHPASKFMLHFSGSLIHDLLWFDVGRSPSTVDMLRAGAADGQFEIVGSTYAQNIPYSTDNWDNDVQIKTQREVIEKALTANPTSFWNAERCWKQQLVPLIAGNGYDATWVETHIINDSGTSVPEHALRKTRLGDDELAIFNDDGEFTGLLDYAIDSGSTSELVSYLTYLHSQDTYRDFVICYCEDAEATGLWDYEGGNDPQSNWDNLDHVLDVLESLGWVKITTFHEYLASHQPTEMLYPIVDGQGSWMIGPSRQAGYDDWFDYNERSPLLAFYRDFFATWRERIRGAAGNVIPQSAADNLVRHAYRSLAAHQFEFGCIGCGSLYCQDYQKLETVEATCLAIEYAKSPVSSTQVHLRDADGDSIEDVVLVTPRSLYVFSPHGGRLLYWFDLEKGEELVGNELFMWGYYYLPYREYYSGPGYNDDYHYMVDYQWNAPHQYAAAQPYERSYGIRKKALNDFFSFDGEAPVENLLNDELTTAVIDDTIRFTFSSTDFTFVKSCFDSGMGLEVRYRITNNGGGSRQFDHRVENSFSPSLLDAMDYGRESLTYINGTDTSSTIGVDTRGVMNVHSGTKILYSFDEEPSSLSGRRDVFALQLNPEYSFALGVGQSRRYGYALTAEVVTDGGDHPPPKYNYHLYQNYPNPFNPATTIRYDVPADGSVTLRIYDVDGRLVRTLVNAAQKAGQRSVRWDGTNDEGRSVASGIYFCIMKAPGFANARKLVVLR
jgi:flagellar hook assembly protein FlgD